jgi:hypothetical protein
MTRTQLNNVSCFIAGLLLIAACASPKNSSSTKRTADPPQIEPDLLKAYLQRPQPEVSKEDKLRYEIAYAFSIADAKVLFSILTALKEGETDRAKSRIISILFVTAAFLPFYAEKASSDENSMIEGEKVATTFLDYLIGHGAEIDPKLPHVQRGLNGLRRTIKNPRDQEKLSVLIRALYGSDDLPDAGPPCLN